MKTTILTALLLASFAQVQAQVFTATLNGANEFPTPSGSAGTGTVNVTLDSSLNTLTFNSGSYTLDVGNVTIAAHIHGPSPVNGSAGVKYDLFTLITPTGANFG